MKFIPNSPSPPSGMISTGVGRGTRPPEEAGRARRTFAAELYGPNPRECHESLGLDRLRAKRAVDPRGAEKGARPILTARKCGAKISEEGLPPPGERRAKHRAERRLEFFGEERGRPP